MPKDNENIPIPFDGPTQPTEREGFSFAEMLTCDECLRSNPPTRIACLYCGFTLPVTESSARLRKPALLPSDKLQPGYNSIVVTRDEAAPTDKHLQEASNFLKLSLGELQQILNAPVPLPLAHTGSEDEANLVTQRMCELGLNACTLSDAQLGISEHCVMRIRSMEFSESTVVIRRTSPEASKEVAYDDLLLLVQGRLLTKTMEVRERKTRTSENEILDASEFFADEPVFDIYCSTLPETWRVSANSFDFSCLQEQKALVVNENFGKLVKLIFAKAPHLVIDDYYNRVRQTLEPVWAIERETTSRGWRRDGPGRLSVGAVTTQSNEAQFTRYSRLRQYLVRNPPN